MSDTPRTDALFGDWLLGKISANQLLRSVCQIEKELTETKKQIIEGAEHLEETKRLLANSVSEQHELQNIAFKLDLQLRAAQKELGMVRQTEAGKLHDEKESLKHKLKLSIDAIKHSECALKKARSFFGNDPFNLHRQAVKEIDCAVALIGRVLKFVCNKAKTGIAQDTEQPPKNQEGTTE